MYDDQGGDERLRELRLRAQAQALHLERTIDGLRPGVPDALERRAAAVIGETHAALADESGGTMEAAETARVREAALSRLIAQVEELLGQLPSMADAPGAEYAAPIGNHAAHG